MNNEKLHRGSTNTIVHGNEMKQSSIHHSSPPRLVTPESAFYRVLEESMLYLIDIREKDDGTEEIVSIVEMTKSSDRTSSRNHIQPDRNAYCVKKMPDEIVASSGRLECVYGRVPTTFIQLAHIEHAYMILSSTTVHSPSDGSKSQFFLKRLPSSEQAMEQTGHFYYRVLVPIELRRGPDLVAPILSRHVFKNAEEIIECSHLYQCPQSNVTFVKLAYEEGWLFEILNSGIQVLERLESEPVIETGPFFYIVRIPVGIRVAPNIMAQRAGKGYKLHSIVEGSQRFTPPGSTITYVKVCRDKNSRCTCSSMTSTSPRAKARNVNEWITLPHGNSVNCSGGWIFETTMDGQVVLESISKPIVRQIERLFYRVLEDVDVLPTPGCPEESSLKHNKRLKDTLLECSERMVPSSLGPTIDNNDHEIGFLKLRHDVGWVAERQLVPPYTLVLEQVQGFAVTREHVTFYRVLVPVHIRSAPDFHCPRLPGISPMTVGSVFESCLQYTPPGSRITYIKVNSNDTSSNLGSGWLFDQTPSGDMVLEPLDHNPEKKQGRFFYRVMIEKKEVLLSPEPSSEVISYVFQNNIIIAEMEYTLPRTQQTYVRLPTEKGWILLDSLENPEQVTLQRVSEEMYNLYHTPPSWVSVGHPNRTWFKVPDEQCRTILVEEIWTQQQVFQSRNILATSSQGRENVPITRRGLISLENGTVEWKCTLEEVKHSASALLFTFPWKQIWWIFELENGEKHCVELQHGLRGGFRALLFDGEIQVQNRSVGDVLWDSGSELTFEWGQHTFKAIIALEGAFFSQYLQFYSYSLLVDEEEIVPIEL